MVNGAFVLADRTSTYTPPARPVTGQAQRERDVIDVSNELAARETRDRSPTRLKRSHNKASKSQVYVGVLPMFEPSTQPIPLSPDTSRTSTVGVTITAVNQAQCLCDETQPHCQRCAKAGRFCEGYAQPKTWLFEPASNTPPNSEVVSCLNTTNAIHFFEDSELNRPTQYFLALTAPAVAGFFAEMMESLNDDKGMVSYSTAQAWTFWNKLVVQASETNASIRHSLAAISSLHEWLELTKRNPWQNHSFTLHYTNAITEINKNQGTIPLEILLIACVLFAHCDFLMGAAGAGMKHLRSGYMIMSESRQKQVQLPVEVRELIEPMIAGFMAKSAKYRLTDSAATKSEAAEATSPSLPEMPKIFQNLSQANKHLLEAVYWVLSLELRQSQQLATMAPSVRKYVTDWATAFDRWKSTYELDDPLMKDWQLLLLAHHRMAFLILKTLPPENDQGYTRAAADFRIMFAQLRTFLRAGYTNLDPKQSDHLVLKTHLGFIAPLFFIATNCRVHEIRQGALEALEDLNVVEGHWNSCVAYAIAKTAGEIDEKINETNPSKTIRIKLDRVDRLKDGTMTMTFYKVYGHISSDEAESKIITEPACHHEVNMQWPVVRVVQLRGFQASVKPRKLHCNCRPTKPTR
ncbi:hypothetical protein LTR13_000558 [Exophiala sideris]|nr:hypothetical protein LTR13_000558 [Exophiala sideris]KAK5184057.1 hypothetical protein LTR44_003563 [Eurotiomycetes sp. CCFEE 6388]